MKRYLDELNMLVSKGAQRTASDYVRMVQLARITGREVL